MRRGAFCKGGVFFCLFPGIFLEGYVCFGWVRFILERCLCFFGGIRLFLEGGVIYFGERYVSHTHTHSVNLKLYKTLCMCYMLNSDINSQVLLTHLCSVDLLGMLDGPSSSQPSLMDPHTTQSTYTPQPLIGIYINSVQWMYM